MVIFARRVLQYVEFASLEGDGRHLYEVDGLASDCQLGLQLPNPNASKANAHPSSSPEALLTTKKEQASQVSSQFSLTFNTDSHPDTS